MSRFLKYTWLPSNPTAICNLQSTAAAGNLLINGILSSPAPAPIISIPNAPTSMANLVASGSSRNITITSVSNLSGVQFTIIGLQNNVPIAETIFGPDGGAVTTSNIFDVVTQIQVSGAVNVVSVGIGNNGFFPLIKFNPDVNQQRAGPFWTLSIGTTPVGVGYFTLLAVQTLDEIANNGIPFEIEFNDEAPLISINGANLFPLTNPATLINVNTIIGSHGGAQNSPYVLPYVNEILIAGQSVAHTTTTMIFRQS